MKHLLVRVIFNVTLPGPLLILSKGFIIFIFTKKDNFFVFFKNKFIIFLTDGNLGGYMLKVVKIKNAFGIQEFFIDFTLKNVQKASLAEQIIVNKNDKIALSPLFLAKNGAGKTSFVRTIDFALRFAKKETFITELLHYKMSAIDSELQYLRRQTQNNALMMINAVKDANLSRQFNERIINRLFREISFAGAKKIEIYFELTNKRTFILELTAHTFVVILNDKVIDINYLLNQIIIEDLVKMAPSQTAIKISSILKVLLADETFLGNDINMQSLFKGVHPATRMNEIYLKNFTSRHIQFIADNMGIDSTIFLLKKLDNNIKNIKFNPEIKDFEIYLKSINSDWPIVPRLLSYGTQKFLEIFARSISLFKNGGVMLIDEIENGLHLSLIKLIIALYTDPDINKKHAQIILTTHNPLIAERNIINAQNVFMQEENNFVSIKKMAAKKRASDIIALVKNKNYYNDIFWSARDGSPKSSLSNLAINQIINNLSEAKNWPRT